MSGTVDIVALSDRWRAMPEAEAIIRRAVEAVERALPEGFPPQWEVAVALTDDAHMRLLNARYRQMDKATNVLAFRGQEEGAVLGDIALGFETLAREAAEEGKATADHVSHLAIHGLLHLLGYDHDEADAAAEMEALETRLLATLGIADPYADPPD